MWAPLRNLLMQSVASDSNDNTARNSQRIDNLEDHMKKLNVRESTKMKQKTQIHIHINSCSGCNTQPGPNKSTQPSKQFHRQASTGQPQKAIGYNTNSNQYGQPQGPNRLNQNQGIKSFKQGSNPTNHNAKPYYQGHGAQKARQGNNNPTNQCSNRGFKQNPGFGQQARSGNTGGNRESGSNGSKNKKVIIVNKTVVNKKIIINKNK